MENKDALLEELIRQYINEFHKCIQLCRACVYYHNKVFFIKQAIKIKRLLNEAVARRDA